MRRALATIFTIGLLAALLPMGASVAANGTGCWKSKSDERGFTHAINRARQGRGLRSLQLDPELSKVARVHTREMVRANELHHTSTTALTRRVTNWVSLGENVGVGGTVTSLHAAFMASPAHKDNVLLPAFNHVGIGTKQVGDDLWVTVVFEARTDPGTTLAMPSC
jgi:uncharacterized protein YkwD